MRRFAATLPFGLLGAAALAGPVVTASGAPAPGDAQPCRLAWCAEPTARVEDALGTGLSRAAEAAKAGEGHDCLPAPTAGQSRPGRLPPVMVLTRGDGPVRLERWTYPAPAGTWVYLLCYRR